MRGASKRPCRASWRALGVLWTRRGRLISLWRPTLSLHVPQGRCAGRRGKQSSLRPDSKLGGRRGGDPGPQGSTGAPWPCRSPAGFRTGSTSDRWPSNLAWSVAASPRIPTICGSRKGGALSRKVSDEFTVPLCRGHHREVHRCGDEAAWWRKTGSIRRSVPGRCGWKLIRCQQLRTKRASKARTHWLLPVPVSETPSLIGRSANGSNVQNEANIGGRPSMTSFRQIEANRECAQKHRSDYRRGQAALPLQCRSPWAHRRNRDRCARRRQRLQSVRSSHHR